ncbi:MAG: prepilin-type N-terminal cleavage/methylation domain-containing protein [Lentisphaerae bacterium]|jgi:prepilin-type N-terminal cleavage/methylation domain-containing protein|nr:prepilin-type N-terminal cleavage/methylation domain-containing protein [Lentisphaerota bacterium]
MTTEMRRHGFTLIELLIAAAISTLVVISSLVVLNVGMTTFSAIQTIGLKETARERFVSSICSDLRSANSLNGIFFRGERDSMTFARLLSPVRNTQYVEAAHVNWKVNADGGMVRTLTHENGSKTEEVFDIESGVVFSYCGYVDQNAGAKSDELLFHDEWVHRKYPGLVRIKMGTEVLDVNLLCSDFLLAGSEVRGGRQ